MKNWLWVLLFLGSISLSALTMIDDFNDGNLNGWTVMGGTWQAVGGVAQQTASGGYGQIPAMMMKYQGSVPTSNFIFQADITTNVGTDYGNNAIGLAFHIQDANNFYTMHIFPGWGGGAFRFVRYQNGNFNWVSTPGDTHIGFTPLQGSFYTMRVAAVGSSYTVSIWNGTNTTLSPTFQQTYVDAAFTGGSVGLWNTCGPYGNFDNIQGDFSVSIPEPGTLLSLFLGLALCARIKKGRKF